MGMAIYTCNYCTTHSQSLVSLPPRRGVDMCVMLCTVPFSLQFVKLTKTATLPAIGLEVVATMPG